MAFLQGNLALILGLSGFALTVVARALSRDEAFRRDVGGAVSWFGLFLVLRLNGFWLAEVIPTDWHPWVRVTWMLSFAYGTIRAVVAGALWALRRVSTTPAAKIHRDVADALLYVIASIPILKTQLHIDVATLLGTSAVLSLVLGFALQDTLGNLFSGLSLQLEHPYKVGDFVQLGDSSGRVVQVAWRSTRLETLRNETITVPNSVMAKEKVTNFTRGGLPIGIDLMIGAAYEAPPTLVKAEILEAVREIGLVLAQPAPTCWLAQYGDSSVTYQARFFILDYAARSPVTDEVLSRIWYRFGRAGIELPFPQRVVTLREPPPAPRPLGDQILAQLEIFSVFSLEERTEIATHARERRFGAGEAVVVEGRDGDSYYVVVSGLLSVRAGKPGAEIARLGRGQGLGEMSLLTGEKRTATVIALEDCVLLEFDRDAFAKNFEAHPEHAAQLATLLSQRRAELEARSAASAQPAAEATKILARLKQIFMLRS